MKTYVLFRDGKLLRDVANQPNVKAGREPAMTADPVKALMVRAWNAEEARAAFDAMDVHGFEVVTLSEARARLGM